MNIEKFSTKPKNRNPIEGEFMPLMNCEAFLYFVWYFITHFFLSVKFSKSHSFYLY